MSSNRWIELTEQNPEHSAWYVERFRAMAAAGDDLAGEALAVNLPGTDRERPNWRRRMARTTQAIFADPSVLTQLRAMSDRRG